MHLRQDERLGGREGCGGDNALVAREDLEVPESLVFGDDVVVCNAMNPRQRLVYSFRGAGEGAKLS